MKAKYLLLIPPPAAALDASLALAQPQRCRATRDHAFGDDLPLRVGRVILETPPGTRRRLVEICGRDLVE